MFKNSPLRAFLIPLIIGILIIIVGFFVDISSENKRNVPSDVPIVISFKEVTLPESTISLPVSALPGYNLALQKCTICHSVEYMHYQPPGMDQKAWTSEVWKMVDEMLKKLSVSCG